MAALNQDEFDAKYKAMRAHLARVYAVELAAAVKKQGFYNVDELMDVCSSNESSESFADGECSDEAIEFIADSIVGAICN
jgi:hypothetical protein